MSDPRSDEIAVQDELLDQAIANMPSSGTYDYVGDVYAVPAGTVAVWQTHPGNVPHYLTHFEVASRLAEDYPEYVTWRFSQRCDVPDCGKWHRPDELCECGLVPDEWAETHRIAQEIRSVAAGLHHVSKIATLFAIRHNLSVAATAAQEAADEANRRIREMVPDDPHDWPDEAVSRLMDAVRGGP